MGAGGGLQVDYYGPAKFVTTYTPTLTPSTPTPPPITPTAPARPNALHSSLTALSFYKPVPGDKRAWNAVTFFNQIVSRLSAPDGGQSRKSSILFAWNGLIQTTTY